jgi:hypothetical protein
MTLRPRVLMGIAVLLTLLAAERLLSASLLGFVQDQSRSVRLAVAFICAGLAPLLIALALVGARQRRD